MQALPGQQPQQSPVQGMPMPQDPLADLQDIDIPTGVNWWPLDWGWWCLLVVVVLIVTLVLMTWKKRRERNKARKEALVLIDKVSSTDAQWPLTINSILKRVMITYASPESVASMHGREWTTSLLQCVNDKQKTKIEPGLDALQRLLYQPTVNDNDFLTIQAAVRYWLRHAQFTYNALPVASVKQEAHHA
ncbi:DUF4381 domain-containing protein [Alteromonas sp. A079]|uniref:DUF4381 domain-containing protein n=1 Tax=Alteromonas sp. A079 TaxID=3410268 RepID=UPI003BA0F881